VMLAGLGQPQVARKSGRKLVAKDGDRQTRLLQAWDYRVLDEMPAVIRKRNRASTIEALQNSGVDK